MALQGEKAELAQAVLDVAKTAFRWGVIPAIIYFGAEGRWQRRMRDGGEERKREEKRRGAESFWKTPQSDGRTKKKREGERERKGRPFARQATERTRERKDVSRVKRQRGTRREKSSRADMS